MSTQNLVRKIALLSERISGESTVFSFYYYARNTDKISFDGGDINFLDDIRFATLFSCLSKKIERQLTGMHVIHKS